MTSTGASARAARSSLRDVHVAVLVALGAGAWIALVRSTSGTTVEPGTMGMGLGEFASMWALMMTAMMLPAVAPVAGLYARSFRTNRNRRLAIFVAGYLIVWALTAVPAYYLIDAIGTVVGQHPDWARPIAVIVFAAVGIYQLSPLKLRCLRHCRSPLGQLLHYGNYRGATRDFRVALHHASFCLGCCWGLMLLFVAFGAMNLAAAAVLALVVAAEKRWRHGEALGRVLGVACLVLAVLVIWVPGIAPGLDTRPPSGTEPMHMG